MWTLAQTCDFAERIKGRGDGTMKKICCKGGDFRFDSGILLSNVLSRSSTIISRFYLVGWFFIKIRQHLQIRPRKNTSTNLSKSFFCHNRNFFCSPLLKDGEIFWHKDLKNGTLHQQQHMLLWGAKNDYIIIIRVSQRRMDLGREFWLSVIKNTC